MKAFIFDPLWDDLTTPEQLENLRDAGIELHVVKQVAPLSECKELFSGTEERIIAINPDYVSFNLTVDDYKDIPNLKAIYTISTSFSWIDLSYANDNNIVVCNVRGFSSQAVAEWATMIMLNLARQIPMLIKAGFPLDYDKDYMKYRGIELKGKTAAIIGLGNIGSAIAERCKGLGMNVIYWSQNSRDDQYEYMELDELVAAADVVFPVMSVTDETKALVNEELMSTMKSTAMLVDIVELVSEEVALNMVSEHRLFGYGFEGKPQAFNTFEGNVWAAPPYAWTTDGSMFGCENLLVENILAGSKNEFPNRVN